MEFKLGRKSGGYVTAKTYSAGVLTGLIVGLTVGMLFAPRSGKKTRKRIQETLADQTKEIQNQWDKATSEIQNQWDKTTSQAKDAVDSIKGKIS